MRDSDILIIRRLVIRISSNGVLHHCFVCPYDTERMTGPGSRPINNRTDMIKFKNPAMEMAYMNQLEGAKGSQFNGCVVYKDKAEAQRWCSPLQLLIDTDVFWIGNVGDIKENEVRVDDMAFGRLHAINFLAKVVESNPVSAEFELENEDGEQFQLKLSGDTWTLLERNQGYHEVV